jgi:hypothetical protein
VERRGRLSRGRKNEANWKQGELVGFAAEGGSSLMDGTSHVTGDRHARICEELG